MPKITFMNRAQELDYVKDLIKKHYEQAAAGLFFTRNIAGDPMDVLFEGQFITLEICESWSYYEVFGCDEQEEKELKELYGSLSTSKE